jgi:hypothetical protein
MVRTKRDVVPITALRCCPGAARGLAAAALIYTAQSAAWASPAPQATPTSSDAAEPTPLAASPSPSAERAGLATGVLTKLDLSRRSIVVVVARRSAAGVSATEPSPSPGRTSTELEFVAVDGSRFVARGREMKFEDLRLDSRVSVTWREDGGRRVITLVRVP